jgi:GTP-binding protein EngB required for normal cell division
MQAEERGLLELEIVASERKQDGILAEAREARTALALRRFNVAVMGQFKRGKSTLINALLARDLLPTDVAPVTTAITAVEHGPRERATVRFEDGREEEIGVETIRLYVSEEENPGNRKGVRVVRIELPAPLLASGMRLVDTPGVGSVFASNAEVTRSFLPRIDVAVVVLGSDPPISGEELALVKAASPDAGRICFVLNKADRVREATRLKAEAFTRQVLREALGRDPEVLIHASARVALRDGEDPGVAALFLELSALAARSGVELARASATRAARHVAARLLQQLDLERAALVGPLEEISRRIDGFLEAMRDIDDLVIAACARVKSDFGFDWPEWESRRDDLVNEVVREIGLEIEREADQNSGGGSLHLRGLARETARRRVREEVDGWARRAIGEFNRHSDEQIARVAGETNRLIGRAAEAAARAFDIPVARFEPEALTIHSQAMVFEFIEPVQALDLEAWLIPLLDLFSLRPRVVRRARRRGEELAKEWLRTNLYEVDRHLVNWIDAVTRQLETGMRARLTAMQQEVLDAVEAGRLRRAEGEAAVGEELERLSRQRQTIQGVLVLLRGDPRAAVAAS